MADPLPLHPGRTRLRAGTGQRLAGVFGLFILLPGVLLAAFGLRALTQEGQLARQRAREGLERTAADIGRDLDAEFERWNDALSTAVSRGRSLDPGVLPEPIRAALGVPGGGVVLGESVERPVIYPPGAILYPPSGLAAEPTPVARIPRGLVAVEAIELVRKEYAGAARRYRDLLATADPGARPVLHHRLARTLRKAGRTEEAGRTYWELLDLERVWIGDLPSDLIARAELCSMAAETEGPDGSAGPALEFYRLLAAGTWLLDKPRYLYYSEVARSCCLELGVEAGELDRLQALEGKKLGLSRAAELISSGPGEPIVVENGVYLAFRSVDPAATLIISASILGTGWWPGFMKKRGEDLGAVLLADDGTPIFGSASREPSLFVADRDVEFGGARWRLGVWPLRPEAIDAGIAHRRTFLLAILGFIMATLVFGTYLTVRIVRRELEIARLRADFVSTVSHEFRSPLTGIRQLGGMLLDGRVPDPEKQRAYFRMIVRESDRLTRLVENVLDFCRMEEGRREYRFELIEPSPWLRSLAAEFAAEVPAGGPGIEAAIPEALPEVLADKEALGTAVRNLLDNAVKYSPGAKTVWISAGSQDEAVWISVRDEGVGISDEDQKRVFDRFFRTGGEIAKRVKGAGLGLSLVEHIVAAHGGTARCRSRLGESSTFTIRVPVAPVPGGGKE